MKPVRTRHAVSTAARVAIVLSGSPLFSGGRRESEIRRWIIENDWLEGIVALPDQMFYNTGISTYVWILTNRKPSARAGTVTLIDARELGTKMRKSLGDKRKLLAPDAIALISRLYADALALDSNVEGNAQADARVKVMRNEQFGFQRITVERPLRRRWEATPGDAGTIAVALADRAVVALPEVERESLDAALSAIGSTPSLSGKEFSARLTKACASVGVELDAKARKAVLAACAVYDPDAPIISNRRGDPEPDADLRDAENVPLPAGFLALMTTQRRKCSSSRPRRT